LQVAENSSLIGTTWEKSKVKKDEKVDLIKFIRNRKETSKPPRTKIKKEIFSCSTVMWIRLLPCRINMALKFTQRPKWMIKNQFK
jgi:hypothetical protein